MKHWLRRAAALWIAAVLFANQAGAAPAISAKRAVVLDAATGRVLFAQHAEARAGMASTTKIMTGLLVAETCALDAPVEIPPEAVGVEGSSLSLEAGEVLRVETLLYGLLLHSGNDAAADLLRRERGGLRGPDEPAGLGAGAVGYPLCQSPRPGRRGPLFHGPGSGAAGGSGHGKRSLPAGGFHQDHRPGGPELDQSQ